MNKVIVSLALLFFFSTTSFTRVHAEALSPTAEFSLITVSPGDDLYSSFGHSAFLIKDTTNGIFKIYNYGTFDFEDPNFYWNFTRGKLKYKLNVEDPMDLLRMSRWENRFVTQQILNLSSRQAQRLYDFLENNALPQNRFYKYDFFYDNCSTRLRDALIEACGEDIKFNLKTPENPISFRQAIDPYLETKRFEDLGMDIGMGIPADDLVSPAQQMFLPNNLKDIFRASSILIDGKMQEFVIGEQVVLPNKPFVETYSIFEKPWFYFFILLLIILGCTLYQYKKDKNGFVLDAFLFGILGVFGLFLLFLWFFTDHAVTIKNMNLLWTVPLHLPAIYLLIKKKNIKKVSSYFLVNFFIMMYLLIFWNFLSQELNMNLIPLLIAIAVRSMYIYYRIDKNFVRWKN